MNGSSAVGKAGARKRCLPVLACVASVIGSLVAFVVGSLVASVLVAVLVASVPEASAPVEPAIVVPPVVSAVALDVSLADAVELGSAEQAARRAPRRKPGTRMRIACL